MPDGVGHGGKDLKHLVVCQLTMQHTECMKLSAGRNLTQLGHCSAAHAGEAAYQPRSLLVLTRALLQWSNVDVQLREGGLIGSCCYDRAAPSGSDTDKRRLAESPWTRRAYDVHTTEVHAAVLETDLRKAPSHAVLGTPPVYLLGDIWSREDGGRPLSMPLPVLRTLLPYLCTSTLQYSKRGAQR